MSTRVVTAWCVALALTGCTLPFDERGTSCDVFADHFDGDTEDFWEPHSFRDGSATIEETDGQLVIGLADNAAGDYAGYLSDELDFTGCSARIVVEEVPNASTRAQAYLKVDFPFPTSSASLIVELGLLRARFASNGSVTDRAMVSFDRDEHRHWRLRHEDGALHYETSADGSSWEALSRLDGADLERAQLGISGGQYEDEPAPGRARFDELCISCP